MSRVILRDANLLDGERAAQPHQTVVIEGNQITQVGEAPAEAGPEDQVFDLAGRTLMPGMAGGRRYPRFCSSGSIPFSGLPVVKRGVVSAASSASASAVWKYGVSERKCSAERSSGCVGFVRAGRRCVGCARAGRRSPDEQAHSYRAWPGG